jgi:hypothetical protein
VSQPVYDVLIVSPENAKPPIIAAIVEILEKLL